MVNKGRSLLLHSVQDLSNPEIQDASALMLWYLDQESTDYYVFPMLQD